MRVLLLNQFYKPDVAATGQLLADLAEELARRGDHVHILCSRRMYDGGETKLPASEVINGVSIHRLGTTGFGRGRLLGRLADYISFYLHALMKAIQLPKMDVCVALTTPPFVGLIGLLLRRLKGTKVVLWTMDLYPGAGRVRQAQAKLSFASHFETAQSVHLPPGLEDHFTGRGYDWATD